MKNKRLLPLLLGLLLALCGLCACKGEEQPGTPTDTTAPVTNEEPTAPPAANGALSFVTDGTLNYRLVYPDGNTLMQEYANSVADVVKGLSGTKPAVQKESVAENTGNGKPGIYFGACRAAEQAGLLADLQTGEYRIAQAGENVFVLGNTTKAMNAAVAQVTKALRNGKKGTSITLSDFEKRTVADADAGKIPPYPNAWGYAVGGSSREMLVSNATQADWNAYLAQLTAAGYKQLERRSVQGLEYAMLRKEADCLFVTLSCNELRAVYEPADACWLPEDAIAVGDYQTTGYLMGVYGGGTFQNGMCMFYLLSDGSFVVFDGGHNSGDAANLYNSLKQVAEQNGIARIRIAALIVTHFHADHCGFFESFINTYRNIEIDRAVLMDSSTDLGVAASEGSGYAAKAIAAVKNVHPNAKIVRLHTGQLLTLGDMQLEMLYTPADLPAGGMTDYNDSSLVMRLTVNGKNILMTGDAANATWNLLSKKYGTYLKSDYLQVPHHGAYGGGTIEAYNLIRPEKLYWPAGEELLAFIQQSNNPEVATHLFLLVKRENIFLAGVDGKLTSFTFS